LVSIIVRAYDIDNLKAILRGVSKRVPPQEILASVLPVGELGYEVLAGLTRAVDPRQVVDLLASMVLPIAQPLLKLRVDRPGAGLPVMETCLDQWYFREAFQCLKKDQQTEGVLFQALLLEADIRNLLTIFRFVQTPGERSALRDWLDSEDLSVLFVGPGKLPSDLLTQTGNQESIGEAVEVLAGTQYEPALRKGLSFFASTGKLSEFEKQLRGFRLERMSGLISKDPLGIGVVLGYLALKLNELSNIRWIAHGINLGLPANNIRLELVYPV
jgi:V/A-type H+-transporting ATPase subunit C